jgi:hypothetical protein
MATTWSAIQTDLRRLLNDEGSSNNAFNIGDLVWAWNAAQRHFTHHTPRQRIKESLVVESDNRTAILPEDFYEMGRLYDPINERWWEPMLWQPGGIYDNTSDTLAYAIWGHRLKLYDSVSANNSFELWYYAYWPDVTYNSDASSVTEDKILIPVWAECAVLHLAGALSLNPGAVEAARQRNWNIKIDSGTPTDNCRATEAWELYKWYTVLIGAYPPLNRGGHV